MRWGWGLALLATVGCGSESVVDEPKPDPDPEPEACGAGERPLDGGGCLPAGVTGCADGFEPEGAGCAAVLAESCPPALMAVPGEAQCRPIMPCGDPPWGEIPVEAGAIHVDQGAAPGGDGSEAAPFATLAAAMSVASAGSQVVLAQGTYAGVTLPSGVRLWGRCPELVALDGNGVEGLVFQGAGGEVHGVTLTSDLAGVVAYGGSLLLDRVHVTATGEAGIRLFDDPEWAVVELRDSLVEGTTRYGIWMAGSELTMARSVVRGLTAGSFPFSQAVAVQPSLDGQPSRALIRQSVIEHNEDVGVAVFGSEATLETSVVRHTMPRADGAHGRGVVAQDAPMSGPASLTISGSVLRANHEIGLFVAGSTALVSETSVVATQPGALSGEGRGVDVESSYLDGSAGTLTMSHSLVADSIGAGLLYLGASGELESVAVTGVVARPDGSYGMGVVAQDSIESGVTPTVAVRYGRIAETVEAGFSLTNGEATVLGQLVEDVTASSRGFGDAYAVAFRGAPSHMLMEASEARRAERAALAMFGASASLVDARLFCSTISIAVSEHQGSDSALEDRGNNLCGCDDALEPCKALGPTLEPPEPLDALGE